MDDLVEFRGQVDATSWRTVCFWRAAMKHALGGSARLICDQRGGAALEWGWMLAVVLAVSGGLYFVGQIGGSRIGDATPDVSTASRASESNEDALADGVFALGDQLDAQQVARAEQGARDAQAAGCRDIVVPMFGLLPVSEFYKCLVQEFQDNEEFQFFGDIIGTTDAQIIDFLTQVTFSGTRDAIIETTPRIVRATPDLIDTSWSWLTGNSPIHVASAAFNAVFIEPLTFMKSMVAGTMANSAEIIAAWSANDGRRAGRAARSIASGAPEALMFLIFDVSDYKDMAKLAYRGSGKLAAKVIVENAPEVIEHAIPRRAKLLPAALCFTAGTQVQTHEGLVNIERIELGDRVLTTRGAVENDSAVDGSWSRVELEMQDPRSVDGILHIAMLRPPTWVEENQARVGAMIEISLAEMGVRGQARITSISDAPRVRPGVGRLVLMTVESQSANVLVLKLHGEHIDETLEPTFGHRLYSLDRNDWIEAGKLRVGERLRAIHGTAVIASIAQKPGIHDVYNFEVEAEHEYLVGALGVQSHNDHNCWATPSGAKPQTAAAAIGSHADAFDANAARLQALRVAQERYPGSVPRIVAELDDVHYKLALAREALNARIRAGTSSDLLVQSRAYLDDIELHIALARTTGGTRGRVINEYLRHAELGPEEAMNAALARRTDYIRRIFLEPDRTPGAREADALRARLQRALEVHFPNATHHAAGELYRLESLLDKSRRALDGRLASSPGNELLAQSRALFDDVDFQLALARTKRGSRGRVATELVRQADQGPEEALSVALRGHSPTVRENFEEFLPRAEGLCFTAGTRVHTSQGLAAIEDIELGHRVLTIQGAVYGETAVDTSWRRIELEMEDPRSADGMLHIAMLRPTAWIDASRARIGGMIEVDLREMQVHGTARITSIGNAPRIVPGIGRVVLMTVQSQSTNVLVLKLRGARETLEPTFGHRLHSIDRNAWIEAGKLRVGERLRAMNGEAVVASITRKSGTHVVYNFEVEAEHEYLVGALGVQSHNDHNCGPTPPHDTVPTWLERRLTNAADSLDQSPKMPRARGNIRDAQSALRGNVELREGLVAIGDSASQRTAIRKFVDVYTTAANAGRNHQDSLNRALGTLQFPDRQKFEMAYRAGLSIERARHAIASAAGEVRRRGRSDAAYQEAIEQLRDPAIRRELRNLGIASQDRFLATFTENAHLGATHATAEAAKTLPLVAIERGTSHRLVELGLRASLEEANPLTTASTPRRVLPLAQRLAETRRAVDDLVARRGGTGEVWRARTRLDDLHLQRAIATLGENSRERLLLVYAENAPLGPEYALRRAVASLGDESAARFWTAHATEERIERAFTFLTHTAHALRDLPSRRPYLAARATLRVPAVHEWLAGMDDETVARFLTRYVSQAGKGAEEALDRAREVLPTSVRSLEDVQSSRLQIESARSALEGRARLAHVTSENEQALREAIEQLDDPVFRSALDTLDEGYRARLLSFYEDNAHRGAQKALDHTLASMPSDVGARFSVAHAAHVASDVPPVRTPRATEAPTRLPTPEPAVRSRRSRPMTGEDRTLRDAQLAHARRIIDRAPTPITASRDVADARALLDNEHFQAALWDSIAHQGTRARFLNTFARNARLGPEAAIEQAVRVAGTRLRDPFAQIVQAHVLPQRMGEAREQLVKLAGREQDRPGVRDLYREAERHLDNAAFQADLVRHTGEEQRIYLDAFVLEALVGPDEASRRALATVHSTMTTERKAKLASGLCFTAGTMVHTPGGLLAIESVELGDRVLTSRGSVVGRTSVDTSWRRIELEMEDPRSADGVLRIAMLRAPTWVQENDAHVGATIEATLTEMGVHGRARITSIGNAPRIEPGVGRIVVSTIESQSANVLVLKLRDTIETLEPTFGHRLYSLDRNAWIEAGNLHVGERLRAMNGEAVIASIAQKSGVHTVHNFEVEAEHEYLVGKIGIQSHNDNPCAARRPEPPTSRGSQVIQAGIGALSRLGARARAAVSEVPLFGRLFGSQPATPPVSSVATRVLTEHASRPGRTPEQRAALNAAMAFVSDPPIQRQLNVFTDEGQHLIAYLVAREATRDPHTLPAESFGRAVSRIARTADDPPDRPALGFLRTSIEVLDYQLAEDGLNEARRYLKHPNFRREVELTDPRRLHEVLRTFRELVARRDGMWPEVAFRRARQSVPGAALPWHKVAANDVGRMLHDIGSSIVGVGSRNVLWPENYRLFGRLNRALLMGAITYSFVSNVGNGLSQYIASMDVENLQARAQAETEKLTTWIRNITDAISDRVRSPSRP